MLFQLCYFNNAISIMLFQLCYFNYAISIMLFQLCYFNYAISIVGENGEEIEEDEGIYE